MRPTTFGALGVSAMMHGYLAFDADDELLVPFRTWRNTSTGPAAVELSELFGHNIPLRWSVAHLRQATIDAEPHVPRGRVPHHAGRVRALAADRPQGAGRRRRLGPVPHRPGDQDLRRRRCWRPTPGPSIEALLPEVLVAGQEAGALTEAGAALLDPTGTLQPGRPAVPARG